MPHAATSKANAGKASPSKQRVQASAVALFAARGYRETTVGDIEAEAGLTPRAGGFYRHFASKEDVLEEALRAMAREMIADIRLEDVVALQSPRAELLVVARSLIAHAAKYRALRAILRNEAQLSPRLRKAAQNANAKLAAQDLMPWLKDVLKRSGARSRNERELALIIFGPIVGYIVAQDRGDPAFGLKDDGFLAPWADHWAGWMARGGKD